jgi:Cof subfamily protein (haloacid dehalogenase superfamily)
MPIRLVAIDLDGTLLNSNATISPANRQALAEVAHRGIQVVIVTGRRYQSAQLILRQSPCPMTLISSNGAMIVSGTGETLHRDFLPRKVALQILQAAREYRPYAVVIFEIPGRGQVVMQHGASPEGPFGWYQTHSPELLLQVPELEETFTTDPIQVMFGGPPEQVGPIEPLLLERFPRPGFHLTWTKYLARNLSLLDVMNRGCTKGRTLAAWASQLGIPPSDVMAIGDNFNDLEMLRFAGWPVLMANCSAGLEAQGWPMTLSNEQDGVAAAIEKYILAAA